MSSDNFPPYFAQYRFDKEQNVYKFKRISREHACEWKRFVMAAVHHKKMQTPFIGKLKMPRETKKAVQTLSDSLITREQIEQAVRRMHEAYSKPPRDHYVLIYSPKVVEMAKQQPDFEPLETYIKKIDKPYKGEVGRMRVLGRLCRIVEAGTLGREVGYVMRDDTLMYPDYLRGGQIK
jgi:hypothetical protein